MKVVTHKEAVSKGMNRERPTIVAQLKSQKLEYQEIRRKGLLAQIEGITYLAHQGFAFRNHKESEGNLHQLLLRWSEDNKDVRSWIRENRFNSHYSVSDLISFAGQSILRKVLSKA